MVMNLAPGLDIASLSIIFMRISLAAGVTTLPVYLILFPLTVRQVWLDSFFSGRTLH